jgi:hypothetical protein
MPPEFVLKCIVDNYNLTKIEIKLKLFNMVEFDTTLTETEIKENIEINGSIRDMGNFRKINYSVNWIKKLDLLMYLLFLSSIISIILIYENISKLIVLIGFVVLLIVFCKIIIFLNNKIVTTRVQ